MSGATNSPKHSSMAPPPPGATLPSLHLYLEKSTSLFSVIAEVPKGRMTLKITSPGDPGPAGLLAFSSLSHRSPSISAMSRVLNPPLLRHPPSLRPHFQCGLQNQVDPSAPEMVSWFCKGPERKYFWLCGPNGHHGDYSTLPCCAKVGSSRAGVTVLPPDCLLPWWLRW